MSAKPKVSIVIASYNSGKTIENCLRSLEGQTVAADFEVIVVDSSTDGSGDLIERISPDVRVYRFPERKFPGCARNIGISLARAEIIAFIDADCVADPNWVAEIIASHSAADPVIGGVIDNGNPASYVGWGHYFCEFNQWMLASPREYKSEIPTCCLSIKRWIFDRYGPFLEGTYCSDSAFHWILAQSGYKPLLVPSIKVSHTNIGALKTFLEHEVYHGRHFSVVRASEQGFPILKRSAYVLISPVLPFLLFFRAACRVLARGVYLKQFVFSSPVVFLGYIAWSYGELLGYLLGRRPS